MSPKLNSGKKTQRKQLELQQVASDEEDEETFLDEEGGYKVCDDIYIPPPPKPSGIQDGRRLVITKIEIHNFKSYGQTQTLGPFHKCFTSVVGPNGSGKSNVIDAMLFVFGYRAQKLRLKKLSLLIHNSDTYPNCTSCSVKVFFALIYDKIDNELDIIDGTEFTISRTAHKDNSSYYCIDDRRVQFKEVSARLQSHGVDLRYNRFLILQGEVEQISLMKPKAEVPGESGMLEFLEDIIGTTRLKAPLEKINEKVNELNELRAEKINRCKLVEREKDALEVVRNEAINFLRLENKLIKKQASLYGIHRDKCSAIHQAANQEYLIAQESLNEAMKKLDEIKERQKTKQVEYDEINNKFETISKQLDDCNDRYKILEKEGEQNRCKNTNVFEKGKKMLEDKVAVEKMLKETKEELPKFDEMFEESQKKLKEMEEQFSLAEDELVKFRKTLEGDLKPLRESKEQYENELLNMQKEINEAKSALDLKKSELDQYLLTERQEKSKLISLESELKSNEVKLEEKQNLVKSCGADMPANEAKIESQTKKLKKLEVRKAEIETKLSQNNAILKEAKSLATESESKNRVLNKIMEQKKTGALPGVYGRLGDLATIEKKYDVAISTVAGGQLDSILTDCLKTSSQCIDFLKKNNVGTATFSALDQKRKWRHADFDFEEPAERLIDLIDIHDDRYIPAFSDVLRDTLVVENSTVANKIAFSGRGWVVVTLNGHIYRSSGVMTGGGRPVSGKMRTTSAEKRASLAAGLTSEDAEKMENETRELEQELSALIFAAEKIQKDIAQAKQDNDFIKYQLPTFQMEVEEIGKTIDCLKKTIEEARIKVEQVKPDAKLVRKFETDIEQLQSTYDALKEKAKVWEDKVSEVNDQIKSIIQGKIGPAERKVNKLKKDMEETSFLMSKAEASKSNHIRTIEKCEEKSKEYKREIQESNDLLVQLKEQRKVIRDGIDKLEKERESIENERAEISGLLKIVSGELTKLKDEERDFQNSNLDTKHQLDNMRRKVEEKEKDVNKWTHMIESLKPHALDGEEGEKEGENQDEGEEDLDVHQLQKHIEQIDKDIKKMKPNLAAIEEFKKKLGIYQERVKELEEVTAKRDEHREAYENVKNMRMEEFKEGFMVINRKLKEMYRMITLGGDAELEYCDSLDPFLEGIAFSVRPNKKTWKRISNLSGGEKTLSSLSLIFALHYYKPSPLYVMDEIDAALDFKNVSIVGNYIKDRTKNTQFLIISLRNNMYELSDMLIGIYKTYNSTKSVPYRVEGDCV